MCCTATSSQYLLCVMLKIFEVCLYILTLSFFYQIGALFLSLQEKTVFFECQFARTCSKVLLRVISIISHNFSFIHFFFCF